MPRLSRRKFVKAAAFAGAGLALLPGKILSAPSILTKPRTEKETAQGEIVFRPQFVQRGRGPHLLEWAYATDERWDTFHSNIIADKNGVKISDTEGQKKFGIDVRWNVEGFGYIFLTANNGGEFYQLPASGKTLDLNLNYELANSRVARNRKRMSAHKEHGWKPQRDIQAYHDLSEELLADAKKSGSDDARRGALAQQSLSYALRASEMMELDKAAFEITRHGFRKEYFHGCDARAYYQMYQHKFLEQFLALFNFATISFTVKGGGHDLPNDFELEEGKLNFEYRDSLLHAMREHNVAVEGRELFWFHHWVTPDWLRRKSFDQLKLYVEKHTRDVIGHYREGMYAFEIMNEFHDWANEVQVNPEQAVELTKLACEVARNVNPKIGRVINNCCPFAEYVQLAQSSDDKPAKYRQRTPWQFTRDLVDAGVDFTILGQQMYFPYRDLQDIAITLERLAEFNKPVHVSEVGCPGGPTNDTVKLGKSKIPVEPYAWHRPWNEELQADWLEGVYTIAYSKPFIGGCHWFDFMDPKVYIENGGLLRSPEGETKAAYDRLKNLLARWKGMA